MSLWKAVRQDVIADANNSSTTNLDSGNSYTFTGTSTSTLGVVGIQVSLKTDADTTVYIDQSPDGTNWDIVDSFDYLTKDGGNGWTVQAVNSYTRVRVVSASIATTYFRLQTALCPMVEALPRSLNNCGNLKVATQSIQDCYGFSVENTPNDEQRVVEPFRLCGTTFVGTTKDTNFWTETVANGGTVSQAGSQLTLATNTTANGSAVYQSIRRGRYVAGSSNRFRAQIHFGDTGEANNSRKFGAFDGTDGCYFELDGTSLYAVVCKASTPTRVADDDWNENTVTPTLNSCNTYEIYYNNKKVYFVINSVLKHVVTASAATWSNTLSLPVYLSTTNSSDLSTNKTVLCRVASIHRLGRDKTENQYKNIAGASTTVLKYGSGKLHNIVVNKAGTTATVYDNTAASGTTIATIDTNKTTGGVGNYTYDCPFSTGLTVVTVGAGQDITVIYE